MGSFFTRNPLTMINPVRLKGYYLESHHHRESQQQKQQRAEPASTPFSFLGMEVVFSTVLAVKVADWREVAAGS
jgi:hypothetical protein